MPALAPLLLLLTPSAARLEAHLVQVAPLPQPPAAGQPAPARRPRAVVLIHGLRVHPLSKAKVDHAALRVWQQPSSVLVRRLAVDSDVFAFVYAQTAAVQAVAELADLKAEVAGLRRLGYREVVLVGHSAGGLIARHFVEDHPDAGVTKVIQVCTPNGGSSWAGLIAVRANQAEFLRSMTPGSRRRILAQRAQKRIPAQVEFACVVGTSHLGGDTIVTLRCQWTEDLQRQGVPAYPVKATHREVVRTARTAEVIARLVRERQPRWPAAEVAALRKKLLGD
jgi:pimeloyl-ACP methyl ester carboxylesterase